MSVSPFVFATSSESRSARSGAGASGQTDSGTDGVQHEPDIIKFAHDLEVSEWLISGSSRELCRQVEETDDPKSLIELSDEIVRLINDKRRRITLAKHGVLKVMDRGRPNFNIPPQRAA